MNPQYRTFLTIALRVAIGVLFLYSGLTKITNPDWTAFGFLTNAENFSNLYKSLATPNILPVINELNRWGQTLLGVSLIFGAGVRISTQFGAVLMLLYYLALPFPKVDAHSYIVDQHIIYALVLLLLGALDSGRVWGFDSLLKKTKS